LFGGIWGHFKDERIVGSMMSQHSGARSAWIDFPLGIMPRFDSEEEGVLHATIPKLSKNASSHRIDITSDFKVSLAFDNHKLVVPWITVFDSQKRRTLRKLIITFTKIDHEIIKVDHETEYGSTLTSRIDPSHPSLRGFEIAYRWKDAETEDPVFGLQVLCGTTLIAFMIIFIVVIMSAEQEEVPTNAPSKETKRPRS
jgi:hypothetical protein